MKVDSVLPGSIPSHTVFSKAKKALEDGGCVRQAFIHSAAIARDLVTGKESISREYDQGICIEHGGEKNVFFVDKYHNYSEYVEVNKESEDVRVRLGDSLNEEGYNYHVSTRLRKEGVEVKNIREKMQDEVLIEYGKPPTPLRVEIQNVLNAMNEKFDTPKGVDIPKENNNEQGHQKLLVELKKLSGNLDKQFEYAVGNDAMPEYPYTYFNMKSDHYKKFKREVAKNVARSHAHGMLFTLEGVGDSGLSISVQAPNGDVVGSLTMDSDFDTEHFEFNMIMGDPIEVEVRGLPDISKMSQKGQVSDNFRQLVSEMRKDFALVSTVSAPSDLISDRDISDAISSISSDIEVTGKSPLLLSGSHPDIMSAKLTYLLSQKYPDIVNEGIAMAIENKLVDNRSVENSDLTP